MKVRIIAPEYTTAEGKALAAGDEVELDQPEVGRLIRWGYAVEVTSPKSSSNNKSRES